MLACVEKIEDDTNKGESARLLNMLNWICSLALDKWDKRRGRLQLGDCSRCMRTVATVPSVDGGPSLCPRCATVARSLGCSVYMCCPHLSSAVCEQRDFPLYLFEIGIKNCKRLGPPLSSTQTLGKRPEWSASCPRKLVQ